MQSKSEILISQDSGFQLTRAEIDVQIATAKAYPRNITQFREITLAMVTVDREIAAKCYYILPRKTADGRFVEGPSVRLAEICATEWKNLRYGSRLIEVGQEYITALGLAHDMESNVATQIPVQRRILDKNGKRYSTDGIMNTSNAACSIAKRDAVFGVIPRVFIEEFWQAAKKLATSKDFSLEEQVEAALCYFKGRGVSHEKVYRFLGHETKAEITHEDIVTLKGLKTALEDGELTDAVFDLPQGGLLDSSERFKRE